MPADAGDRQWGDIARGIEIYPNPRIEGGLTHQKSIRRLIPETHLVDFVVENKVSCRCASGEHSVSFSLFVADNGYQQSARRPSQLQKLVPLQQGIVLAVTFAVRWQGPKFGDAVMLQVRLPV